ncbi:MAG: ribosome biogenesis GTPase YlqF [Oscillospiraceae bacterium]|nr:ribosome biogenesis GTPase YlqF [Oscillospiraceae bacterium]MDD4367998.1 ribosome biogenesis GTPase YlqF [Oscillospiraceae bacterium]
MQINWFPGHMAKTLRLIQESLRQVDAVIECIDARLPVSSCNPELEKRLARKPRLILMTKADLADPKATQRWIDVLLRQAQPQVKSAGEANLTEPTPLQVLAVSLTDDHALAEIKQCVRQLCAAVVARQSARGLLHDETRVMIAGIPNTGKSTLINRWTGRKAARAEDRPGVTKGSQWVRTDGWALLDMPGVLWPNLGSDRVRIALAASGAIKDEVFDTEALSLYLFLYLLRRYPDLLQERFRLSAPEMADGLESYREEANVTAIYPLWLEAGRRRGCLLSGGRVDGLRFAALLLKEFRSGAIGRISLEWVEDERG